MRIKHKAHAEFRGSWFIVCLSTYSEYVIICIAIQSNNKISGHMFPAQ